MPVRIYERPRLFFRNLSHPSVRVKHDKSGLPRSPTQWQCVNIEVAIR
jgi:hypothetical protein